MQYAQRKLHRSVTEIRRSRIGRPRVSRGCTSTGYGTRESSRARARRAHAGLRPPRGARRRGRTRHPKPPWRRSWPPRRHRESSHGRCSGSAGCRLAGRSRSCFETHGVHASSVRTRPRSWSAPPGRPWTPRGGIHAFAEARPGDVRVAIGRSRDTARGRSLHAVDGDEDRRDGSSRHTVPSAATGSSSGPSPRDPAQLAAGRESRGTALTRSPRPPTRR